MLIFVITNIRIYFRLKNRYFMGNLIVKSNAFVGASYGLGLVEQRLILLAILKARETNNINDAIGKSLTIHASDYMMFFDVDRATAYRCLENGANGLYESEYRYVDTLPNGTEKIQRYRFLSSVSYSEGLGSVELTFTNETVPLIIGLSENFTKYEIEQIANLTSQYSLRLYELLARWRSVGKFEITLADLRFKFGLFDEEYTRMFDFKRYVLDFGINEINKNTNLTVKYEQNKQGRTIVGFTFIVKQKQKKQLSKKTEKSQSDENMPDMFAPFKMTNKQRSFFASKLSHLHECSTLPYGNESYEALARWIEQDLLNPEKAEFYRPLLAKLDFKG